ncbi:hypothetical protein ACFYVL_19380 [Streptomyces sp. NPDC004111]|uniref:hypothetical protein n=1 Tax=Streptomyces sp. NPDC004111 TaxID=3364690 RepID=UPI0036B31B42
MMVKLIMEWGFLNRSGCPNRETCLFPGSLRHGSGIENIRVQLRPKVSLADGTL